MHHIMVSMALAAPGICTSCWHQLLAPCMYYCELHAHIGMQPLLPNQDSGGPVMVGRHAHRTRATDCELLKLRIYLCKIAHLPSLRKLKHRRWESYIADELEDLPDAHGNG